MALDLAKRRLCGRYREYTLRLCADLLHEGKLEDLKAVLSPYHGGLSGCSIICSMKRR